MHASTHKPRHRHARAPKLPTKPQQGWTPLHSAAREGHEKVVVTLLNMGAATDSATSNGQTALHLAVRCSLPCKVLGEQSVS